MKNLEENRRDNFLGFDDQEPENGHLLRFEKKLSQSSVHPRTLLWKVSRIAAALIILAGLSSVFYLMNETDQTTQTLTADQNTEFPLEEAENYYKSEFDRQFIAISNNYQDDESKRMIGDSQLLIIELEKEYKELEVELKNTGDYRVATAMILNYKSRISILENLIEKLKYVTQLKDQENVTQTS
ncbi:MAG: hypothetical protein JKY48_09235 [Flavobacteriales bacterium]|nr:hypothetical protein [Flavobacteriales bacterium]